jgi:hypothetical protein
MRSSVRTAAVVFVHIAALLTLITVVVTVVALLLAGIASTVDPAPVFLQLYPPRVLTDKELSDWEA